MNLSSFQGDKIWGKAVLCRIHYEDIESFFKSFLTFFYRSFYISFFLRFVLLAFFLCIFVILFTFHCHSSMLLCRFFHVLNKCPLS